MGPATADTVMRLLMTSDLHLGRSSSRVPDGVSRDELRAASVWNRMVDLALQQSVSVVCLGGDIGDQESKFWESIGPLERGISRLSKAGIRTVAVAGNHDFDLLARLADNLPPEDLFTLLGRGGHWERLTIQGPEGSRLHLDGWSFPSKQVQHSPLNSYDLERDPATPTLGLVHGDLDTASSPYAPLELARLQGLPTAGWLLGHIHAPRLVSGPPWVLYPGSPQALDPGETGAHGPWIVEVSDGMLGLPVQHPLSSVWYGRCEIDLTGAEDEAGLEHLLVTGLREQAERACQQAGPELVHASLRLRLSGSTRLAHLVERESRRITADLSLRAGSGSLDVDAVDVQTVPEIDLAETARIPSAPGAVARLLLELDRPDLSEDVAELIRRARTELEQLEVQKEYTGLERRDVTEEMVRDHLQTQARALLTRLLTQNP